MGHEPTTWCRHELKYVITEAQAAAMVAHIRTLIPPDSHANGGVYPIVSQYLDTADLRMFRESLEGVKNRFKLRVRSYTDKPDVPYSVEIKSRINRIISKRRAWVPKAGIASVLGSQGPSTLCPSGQDSNLDQFVYYRTQLRAASVMRVRYVRQAFEADCAERLRVTFDRRLHFNTNVGSHVELNGRGWQPFPDNPVVLEIKFNGWFPAWLSRVIRCMGIQERSFSKYALAVTYACGKRFCAPQAGRRVFDGPIVALH